MKRVIEHHHRGSAGEGTRNFDRVLDSFGAGRDEHRFCGASDGRNVVQALGERHVVFIGRHLEADVRKRIELILDGGRVPGGVPSTVVDCTGPFAKVLREGPISAAAIEAAVNEGEDA